MPKKTGRPTKYTQELGDEICERLSMGVSLRSVCNADDMPHVRTVFRWLRKDEEFCHQYTRAKQESADSLVDEMLDISDDARNDWMERRGENSEGYELNGEHVQRTRLRIETRKWLASKLKPKKYGDRVTNVHEGTLSLSDMTEEQLDARLAQLVSKSQ